MSNFPKQKKLSYHGLHLDRCLTLHKHFFDKWKHLGITLSKMYWLLCHKSKLSISNKLLAHKVILKPFWTYGIQLWGSASISNIEILELFQGKALCMITKAPWYVQNMVLRKTFKSHQLKKKSTDSACNTGTASTHIPTTSQFTSRYHQTTGD
jgi:hypothetical protein